MLKNFHCQSAVKALLANAELGLILVGKLDPICSYSKKKSISVILEFRFRKARLVSA